MRRALVIDDELDLREIHQEILMNLGFEVTLCNDGLEAFMALEPQKFHIVITDLNMPKVNGQELVKELLAIKGGETTPVVIVSGYINDNVRENFKNNANVNFLPKPFKISDLGELITKIART